jgi:hypothetical protein
MREERIENVKPETSARSLSAETGGEGEGAVTWSLHHVERSECRLEGRRKGVMATNTKGRSAHGRWTVAKTGSMEEESTSATRQRGASLRRQVRLWSSGRDVIAAACGRREGQVRWGGLEE